MDHNPFFKILEKNSWQNLNSDDVKKLVELDEQVLAVRLTELVRDEDDQFEFIQQNFEFRKKNELGHTLELGSQTFGIVIECDYY